MFPGPANAAVTHPSRFLRVEQLGPILATEKMSLHKFQAMADRHVNKEKTKLKASRSEPSCAALLQSAAR